MNWQLIKDNPIPKDGRRILFARKDPDNIWRYAVGRWTSDHGGYFFSGSTVDVNGRKIELFIGEDKDSHWCEIKSPEEI